MRNRSVSQMLTRRPILALCSQLSAELERGYETPVYNSVELIEFIVPGL